MGGQEDYNDSTKWGSKTRDSSPVKEHGFPDITFHNSAHDVDPRPVEEQKDPKELPCGLSSDSCRGGCPIFNDLRDYGFPDFQYTYTDRDSAMHEHKEHWRQLSLPKWGFS